jgi:DnaJ-domain-containing protein 1
VSQSHLLCQQKLHEILQSLLPLFEKGISEYEIITLLKQPPHGIFNASALHDSLVLFQTHFILFHTLYKLRSEWRTNDIGELDIVTTNIKLNPTVHKHKNTLETTDLLAQYYLDWNNLTSTDQAEVDKLLASFWVKMSGSKTTVKQNPKAIQDAINMLELNDYLKSCIKHDSAIELSIEQLKSQYRKLQHRYHPDKGGSSEKAQLVLQAYEVLCEYLERNGSNTTQ